MSARGDWEDTTDFEDARLAVAAASPAYQPLGFEALDNIEREMKRLRAEVAALKPLPSEQHPPIVPEEQRWPSPSTEERD